MTTALTRVWKWHETEEQALSPFGCKDGLRKKHGDMKMTAVIASDHLEIMASALMAFAAYKAPETAPFEMNHKMAFEVAKLYAKPLPKVKVVKK